jgi:hypothetical protein
MAMFGYRKPQELPPDLGDLDPLLGETRRLRSLINRLLTSLRELGIYY